MTLYALVAHAICCISNAKPYYWGLCACCGTLNEHCMTVYVFTSSHTHTARVRQKESEREKTAIIPNKPYRKSATMDFIFQFHSMYIFILLILDIFFLRTYVCTYDRLCVFVCGTANMYTFIYYYHAYMYRYLK